MTKGQLLSLDFLLSLILVTLAMGLLLQFFEANTYAQKQEEIIQELSIIGETSADLVASSESTVCIIGRTPAIGGNDYNTFASNCLTLCTVTAIIPGQKSCTDLDAISDEQFFAQNLHAKKIFKKKIGLSEEFGCNINVSPNPLDYGKKLMSECEEEIPFNEPNIYSTTRKIILPNTQGYAAWNKINYLNCIRNTENCDANISTLSLTVWKR